MKKFLTIMIMVFLEFAPLQVFASSQNLGLMNQVAVSAVCMVSADNLNFGNYNPLSGSDVKANTNIYVTCVNGAAYNVYLSAGQNSGSNILNRNMIGAGSGKLLAYQLYGSASTSGVVWGDGSSGTDFQCGVGNGTQNQMTVYGKIPAGQVTASVDNYSDVITVNVTY